MRVPLQESGEEYEACAVGADVRGSGRDAAEDEAACDAAPGDRPGDATHWCAKVLRRRSWVQHLLVACATLAVVAAAAGYCYAALEKFHPTRLQTHWVSVRELRKVEHALVRMERERRRNFTVVAVFSRELVPMTNNWLCSLAASVENVSTIAVLTLAMDGGCEGVDLGVFVNAAAECLPVELALPDPKAGRPAGEVVYQAERYIFFCRAKLALFSAIMDAAVAHEMVGYKWFLFSDVDVAIKDDVFRYFVSSWIRSDSSSWERSARIPGSTGAVGEPLGVFQQGSCEDTVLNTGFYFLRAGALGSRLLNGSLHEMMQGNTYDGADQGAVNHYLTLLEEEPRRHLYLLPCNMFPTGKDYFEANKTFFYAQALHANWIAKLSTKVKCLKTTGDWLLSPRGECLRPASRWPWHADATVTGRILDCLPGPRPSTTLTSTNTTRTSTPRTTTTVPTKVAASSHRAAAAGHGR